MQSIDTIVPCI